MQTNIISRPLTDRSTVHAVAIIDGSQVAVIECESLPAAIAIQSALSMHACYADILPAHRIAAEWTTHTETMPLFDPHAPVPIPCPPRHEPDPISCYAAYDRLFIVMAAGSQTNLATAHMLCAEWPHLAEWLERAKPGDTHSTPNGFVRRLTS